MYCPKQEMKINKFRLVDIPKNRDYMRRLGEVTAQSNLYTGDEIARAEQNKADEIEFYRKYAESKAKERSHKENE